MRLRRSLISVGLAGPCWYSARLFGVAVVVALLLALGASPAPLLAEDAASSSSGITVAPARLQLTLAPGQKEQSATIAVKNGYQVRLKFATSVRDVEQSMDGALVPNLSHEATTLKELVTVTPSEFSLEAGQSINIKVSLVDSSQLAPGGQYAALLVSQVPDRSDSVQLMPGVAASMFVVKEEGAVRRLDATIAETDGSLFGVPSYVDVVFSNRGNVPVMPRAVVRVTDPGGRVVAQGVSNEESLVAMAGKELRVRTSLHALEKTWRPGKYRLSVEYRYEGADETHELSSQRLVLPPRLLLVGVGGIIALCLATWGVYSATRRLIPKMRRKRSTRPEAIHSKSQQSVPIARTAPVKARTTDGIIKRPSSK